jgi:poly-gamma-glutamate capsule biosynthesis protein CapA/YwtB (metallophosphatase superfamily)
VEDVTGRVMLFLCGDVMLGRGVDQILPYPGDPRLRESYVTDARQYVALAEEANGPIPRPVGFAWPWGEALGILDDVAPDVRVVNLETAVTRSGEFAPGKAVHYRMNPANLPALTVARPDVCVLANNHVLDFGVPGLEETLDVLGTVAGAGRDLREAEEPARAGRVVVIAFGLASSGVPPGWAATADRPGVVNGPPETGRLRRLKRPGDIVVASVHWGSNWGYDVGPEQVRLAHRLVDAGADVVHGHSSHHPRPIEVYRGRLILYGCGDLIDDYEGIGGYEEYRDDLRLMYFPSLDAATGELAGLRIAVLRARRMRLEEAPRTDVAWTRDLLDRISRPFGTEVAHETAGMLIGSRTSK